MELKFCRVCKHDWSVNNFYRKSGSLCKTCQLAEQKVYRQNKRKEANKAYGNVQRWAIEQAVQRKADIYRQRIKEQSRLTPGPLDSPCWIWQGSADNYPRLMICIDGVTAPVGAHRLSLSLVLGYEIGKLEASHLCHQRMCVNPNHLIAESRLANMARNRHDKD